MDDILKYWFLLARKRKRSILRCLESDQIRIRARLRGKSKRRAMSVLTAMLLCNSTVERSIWQIPRTSAWFDLAYATYSDDEWYAHFWVSRGTFDFFVDELQPYLKGKETQMRKPVEVKRKVGLFLYFIATTAEYRVLGNLFGVSIAFVCIWIRKVALAIRSNFQSRYISFPKGEELQQVIATYMDNWGYPMCAGDIDGTDIPIAAPLKNHSAYVNRKSYHSIIMQAVVDGRYMLRDIVVGWPGSVHDARVFAESSLYTRGCSNQLFDHGVNEAILGRQIHPVILGDSAYPILKWLMKPHLENVNTPRIQRRFNYRLSRARITVENTFGRWKGRFRRLQTRVDMAVEGVVHVVGASCVLHNICEMRKEQCFEAWLQEGFRAAACLGQPVQDDDECGADVRDTLAAYFMTVDGQGIGYG